VTGRSATRHSTDTVLSHKSNEGDVYMYFYIQLIFDLSASKWAIITSYKPRDKGAPPPQIQQSPFKTIILKYCVNLKYKSGQIEISCWRYHPNYRDTAVFKGRSVTLTRTVIRQVRSLLIRKRAEIFAQFETKLVNYLINGRRFCDWWGIDPRRTELRQIFHQTRQWISNWRLSQYKK
jgi:hypothetical protein